MKRITSVRFKWRTALLLTLALTYLALTGFRVDFRTASSKATDLQIEIASQKRLDSDSRIEEPRKITVKSVNHVVTLGGTVSTLEQKLLAENIIGSTIIGIRGIVDNIRVVPNPVLDEDLAREVEGLLQKNFGMKGAHIKVEVEKGVVYLSGTSKSEGQLLVAEEVAAEPTGVVKVHDEIKIVPEKRSDDLIADNVFYYLDVSPIRTDQIRFTVKNGVVRISGKADNFKDMTQIIRDIKNIRGVVAVESSIDVL